MFKPVIEKDVPMPVRKQKIVAWREWLSELEIGESFVVPESKVVVSNYMSRVGKEMGRHFISAKQHDGRTRVWRSE